MLTATFVQIIANIKPKLIDGKPATGASLALLVQAVVEAFNSGRFPELPSLYTTFVQQSMIEVENKTLAWFKTKADTLTSVRKLSSLKLCKMHG
jgi:hypothetical protein